MTVHDTAVTVDVYPYEFRPILKLINHALMNNDVMDFMTEVEAHYIYGWLNEFQSKALQYGT